MATYTLKIYHNRRQLEVYEHRSSARLKSILSNQAFRQESLDSFGQETNNPNRFEIYDTQRYKIFDGNINECMSKLQSLY